MPMSFSSLSLQTIFIAGLTIVYCLWHANSATIAMRNFNALNDCSIMLYIMTERWNSSHKYRDVFETIKRTVVDRISDGDIPARQVIGGVVSADVRSTLEALDFGVTESNRNALEQMIEAMTGEQLHLDEPREELDMDTILGNTTEGSWDAFMGPDYLQQASIDFDLSI
ncbi:hypothetical protein GQ53DRAFT_774365 [Thozetella sp. PMI_491]|nr:hypothetical protein GQ53DRAFT_774365 [Thozetella sp. PMI_491]